MSEPATNSQAGAVPADMPTAIARVLPPSILFLGLISAIGPLTLALLVPSLPTIQREFGIEPGRTHWFMTMFFVALAAFHLFPRPLADRFGRRSVFYGGFLVLVLASALGAIADNIFWLTTARILQAAGAAVAILVPQVLIDDFYSGVRAVRAVAYVTLVQSIALVVAPLLGGVFETWLTWRAGFWFLAVAALCLMGLALRRLPERPKEDRPAETEPWDIKAVVGQLRAPLASISFLGHALNLALMAAIFFGFLVAGPQILQDHYLWSPMSFAALLSIAALAFIVGRSVGAFVEPQWGGAQLLVIMTILVGAAVILPLVLSQVMPGTAAPKLLAAAMVAYGICHGAIVPSAAVAAVAADDPGARDREATLPVVHFFVAGLVGLVIGLINPQSVTMYLVVAAILAVMSTGALIAALTAAKSRPA